MIAAERAFDIRPTRMEDLEEAVRVLNAFGLDRYGESEFSLSQVRAEWESENLNIDSDTRVAFDSDGRMVAFAEFWDDPNGRANDLQCYVSTVPGQVSAELAAELLGFFVDRAEKSMSRVESEEPVKLRSSTWLDNVELREFLEAAGFREDSYNTLMHIEFEGTPEAPVWPEGITVRPFRLGVDDEAVYATRLEAWQDLRHGHPIPYEMWRYYLIEKNDHFDESLWFMAMDGEEVAGICLCSASMTEDPERGWIYSVGVKRPYRKRGIAGAMLRHGFNLLYDRGIRKAGLGVDSDSLTGAHRIYERAGMYAVRQSVNYVKPLTPSGT